MPRTVRRVRTALRGLRGLRGLCPPADELRRSPFHTRLPQATSVPHHHSPSDLHIARVGIPPAAFPSLSFFLLSPSLSFSVSLLTDAACSRGMQNDLRFSHQAQGPSLRYVCWKDPADGILRSACIKWSSVRHATPLQAIRAVQ